MLIRPTDLGARRCGAIIGDRTSQTRGDRSGRLASTPGQPSTGPIGLLGQFWTYGIDADDATKAAILHATRQFSAGFGIPTLVFGLIALLFALVARTPTHSGPPLEVAAFFGTISAIIATVGLLIMGPIIRKYAREPVNEGEIDGLLGAASDDLEREFLRLVRDALRRNVLPPSVADEVRGAIHTLADAIDSLPPGTPDSASRNPEVLLSEAQAIRERGLAEADPVVSESQLRRADALERSAHAVKRSAQVLRRNDALRAELAAQTEALRLGLAAYDADASGAEQLIALADAARSVAREATSNALAQAEVEAIAPAQAIASATESAAVESADPPTVRAGRGR